MMKTGQPCSHIWHLCGEVGEQDVVVEAVMVAAGRERVLNFCVVLLGVVFGGKGGDWILLFVECKGEWGGKVVD